MLSKLARRLRRLWATELPDDARVRALHRRFGAATAAGQAPVIAVQCVEDPFYLGLFGTLAAAVRTQAGPVAAPGFALVVTRSFEAGLFAGWRPLLAHVLLLNRLVSRRWLAAYQLVSPTLAYSSSRWQPLADLVDLLQAWRAWQRLRACPPQAPQVAVAGLDCTDLVIDSYLRFRPSPRFVANDPFVLYLLWQAHRDVRRARAYFGHARPLCYLSSYSTYVQHGVAVRVALELGVPVLCFGNFQEFGKRLSLDDGFHTRCPVHYRRDFDRLADAPALLLQAQAQLEHRLAGGIDSATAYMASSAYRGSGAEVPDVRGAVVVFLHDFYDSPHVYADLVFTDFWDWICTTIDSLQACGQPFWLKPHPNQVALSDAVITALHQRYPDLQMVPAGVTNRQLVDAGMACAVTVYGTVAHEMAFLGVPSIACARHPHIAFDFCRTAPDRAGYVALLRDARSRHMAPEAMRQQAMQFYVMHNLALAGSALALRDSMIRVRLRCGDPQASVAEVLAGFEALAAEPGLQPFVQTLHRPAALEHR